MHRYQKTGNGEGWDDLDEFESGDPLDMFDDEYSTEEWEPELRLSGLKLREDKGTDQFNRIRAEHRRQRAMKRRRDARRTRDREEH